MSRQGLRLQSYLNSYRLIRIEARGLKWDVWNPLLWGEFMVERTGYVEESNLVKVVCICGCPGNLTTDKVYEVTYIDDTTYVLVDDTGHKRHWPMSRFRVLDETEKKDQVNHPSHYGGADNPYEAIKVIEAWSLGFCLGNSIKYISRAGKKDKTKELEDLKKAQFYLNRHIELLSKAK